MRLVNIQNKVIWLLLALIVVSNGYFIHTIMGLRAENNKLDTAIDARLQDIEILKVSNASYRYYFEKKLLDGEIIEITEAVPAR